MIILYTLYYIIKEMFPEVICFRKKKYRTNQKRSMTMSKKLSIMITALALIAVFLSAVT